ncbi:MAG: Spy/CpxP family protein refolding chaperone [Gemmatimonadaceae bacterium]|nr:Spy/CpxP family protein refolding chaperone [Gemmatimonadaceae bacterium]
MRRTTWLCAAVLVAAAACSTEPTSPPPTRQDSEGIDLVQDLGTSTAAVTDRGGIGGSELPDSLKLTADQKAQIAALHEAYKAATKADVQLLMQIEAEARAAREAGKSREEVRKILARAAEPLARVRAAFVKLQADIWAVYTPAQRAWIASRRPTVCRDSVRLTEAQVKAIRELKVAFEASIKEHIATIKAVHEEARAARAAGKSAEEIRRILARAEPAMQAIRAAELRLKQAINDILTPEQRNNPCTLRGLNG